MQFQHLSVAGSRGEPVPNQFVRQDDEADHLAVLLPGFGYTCDMPLFYYAESILLSRGADVFRVEYAYNRRLDYRQLPNEERRAWLFEDVTAAFQAALAQRPYRKLTLVGKSLGTLALGELITRNALPVDVRIAWLTPLLHLENLQDQMRRGQGPSLIAIGTEDPDYDPSVLDGFRTAGRVVVAVEGADHSFDVSGNVSASIQAVEQIMRAFQELLMQ